MTRAFTRLAMIVAMMAALAAPVRAADAVFPTGSPLGLVPPAGMVTSKNFIGFEDPDKDAAIILRTLPGAAFPQIEKTINSAAIKAQGINVEKREPMQVAIGKGLLVVGRQAAGKQNFRKWVLFVPAGDFTALVTVQVPEQDKAAYPDAVVRAALTSLAVRATVPDDEQLALLPFKIGNLGGLRIELVVPGRALVLTDTPKGAPDDKVPTHFMVAAVPGGPSDVSDREKFARLAFNDIADIKDVRITVSEPLRINGQAGHQMMADAKDARTGVDIKVVQWLRYGGGGFLDMIGIARADGWVDVLAKMRAVRDTIDTP